MNQTDIFFNEFKATSPEEWKNRILSDLAISRPQEIQWETDWGYKAELFYTPQSWPLLEKNQEDFFFTAFVPGSSHAHSINQRVHHALSLGAPGLSFLLYEKPDSAEEMLSGVQEDILRIFFEISNDVFDVFYQKKDFFNKHHPRFLLDPFALALLYGEWHQDAGKDFAVLKTGIPVFVNASVYKEAGAHILDEISFGLYHLYHLLLCYPDGNDAVPVYVQFSFGTSFFEEVAKVRAFRKLIPLLEEVFGRKIKVHIHGKNSEFCLTPTDPYNNLLRITTSAFSAISGTVDSFCALPFDNGFRPWNTFSASLSIQLLHLLKEEALADKVYDPCAGAGLIENMSEDLARKAWKEFLQIYEKEPSLLLKENYFGNKIDENFQKNILHYKEGRKKLLGINIYPPPESMEKFPDYPQKHLPVREFIPLYPRRIYAFL